MASLVFLDGPIETANHPLCKRNVRHNLRGRRYLIGATPLAEINLTGIPGIDQEHARLECIDNWWYLTDLNSTSGTFVDDQRLRPMEGRKLEDGPTLRFGNVVFRFFDELHRVIIRQHPLYSWHEECRKADDPDLAAAVSTVPLYGNTTWQPQLRGVLQKLISDRYGRQDTAVCRIMLEMAERTARKVVLPGLNELKRAADAAAAEACEAEIQKRLATALRLVILPRETLDDAAAMCCTFCLQRNHLSKARALNWYFGYLADIDHNQSPLPIAIPYLIDLGAIVAFNPPPIRNRLLIRYRDDDSLPSKYMFAYQRKHLRDLAFHPVVRALREQISTVHDARRQLEAISLFVSHVFNWVTEVWTAADMDQGLSRDLADISKHSGRPVILPDRIATQEFLIQLSSVVRDADLEKVINPVRRFLLSARPTIPDSFRSYDATLIEECLKSRELDEPQYREEPIQLLPLRPEVPSANPGDELTIRKTKRTNDLAKMPHVLPQEFMPLRLDNAPRLAKPGANLGKRLLIHKLLNDGLQCWERQDYDTELRREKYLVCVVGDIGRYTHSQNTTLSQRQDAVLSLATHAETASSPNTHARRLVFEMLRDIARAVDLSHVQFDMSVFLEPVDDPAETRSRMRISWQLSLEDLQRRLRRKSPYTDMLELEHSAAGFFFPEHRGQLAERLEYVRFMNETFERDEYDFMLFVFLGPPETVRRLIPPIAPPPRTRPGTKDVVMLVQLNQSSYACEVAVGTSFDDVQFHGEFRYRTDEEFRYAVLQEILGKPLVGAEPLFEIA